MLFPTRHFIAILLAIFAYSPSGNSQQKEPPLKDAELLALVAGNALSENVVNEISSRGLVFRATDAYLAQLTDVGAGAPILSALGKATVSVQQESSENKASPALLQHLAAAGKFMRAK